MGNKKYLFSLAILISLLIILIPIVLATEIDTYDNLVLKTSEQRIDLYQSDERIPGERGYLSDPGKACVAQHEETSSFADSLDSGVISTLEKIAFVLFAICTTMSAIDTVLSTVAMAVGMLTGGCCLPHNLICPGPCGAPCAAMEGVYRPWSAVYAIVKPLCCFVNCGWCTGGDCFSIFGINLGAIPNLGVAGPGGGIGQFGLSPYDNIYLAIGCLCPIAIIFNMRKLKTIYDVYDCCIQEACENSLSTEACERQLDEATCMYWEGSLYSMIATILLAILVGQITNILAEVFGLSQLLICLYAILKIVQVPRMISSVTSAWGYMGRTFDEPNCDDLGFDRLKEISEAAMQEAAEEGFEDVDESLLEKWEYVTLVDQDADGIYDYHTPEWKQVGEKKDKKHETTIRSWDSKKKKYVAKTYIKEDGKVYAADDTEKKKIGLIDWQKIKSSNVPARISLYSDGSAAVGYDAFDEFKIEDSKIQFIKDGKVIEQFENLEILADTKILGTNQRFKDFKRIEKGSLVSGEEGKDDYKKLTLKKVDGKIEMSYQAGNQQPVILPPDVISELEIEKFNWKQMSEKGGLWFDGKNKVEIKDIADGKQYKVIGDDGISKARVIQKTKDEITTSTYEEFKDSKWVGNTESVKQTIEGYEFITQKKWDSKKGIYVDDKVLLGRPGEEQSMSPEVWKEYNPDDKFEPGEAKEIAEAHSILGGKGKLSSRYTKGVYTDMEDDKDKNFKEIAFFEGRTDNLRRSDTTYKNGIEFEDINIYGDGHRKVEDNFQRTEEGIFLGKRITETDTRGQVISTGYQKVVEHERAWDYKAIFNEEGKMTSFEYQNVKYGLDDYGALIDGPKVTVEGKPLETRYYKGNLQVKHEEDWKSVSDMKKQKEFKDKISGDDTAKTTYDNAAKKRQEAETHAKTVTKQEKARIEKEEKIKKGKPAEDKKTKAQKEAEQKVAYNLMYDMVWTLMDLTLGETINDMVKDKCEEDSGKSYPPSDTPTDSGGATGCQGINNNVYNAQFISKTQLTNSCKYEVSYSIAACGSAINYTILLAGTGNDETIETGNLGLKTTISRNRIIESNLCTHKTVCIEADNYYQCYAP